MSTMRYFDRLYSLRDQLEAKLLLHEERHCFGEHDIEDGTASDLRERISELCEEISSLGHKPCYL